MPAELKQVLARQMDIYAGFLEQTDHHVGRLVDASDDLGDLHSILFFFVLGDNVGSGEGTPNGCSNEMCTLNGLAGVVTPEFPLSMIDEFGIPKAYNPDAAQAWLTDPRLPNISKYWSSWVSAAFSSLSVAS